MYVISERNLHSALPCIAVLIIGTGYDPLEGKEKKTQNIVRLPEPLTVEIEKPCERVIFHRDVEINPFEFFFAGMETMFLNMKGSPEQDISGIKDIGKFLREDKLGIPTYVPSGYGRVAYQRGEDRKLDAHISSMDKNPVQDVIIASMVQEVLAKMAGCDVGILTWTSSNVFISKDNIGGVVEYDAYEKLAKEIDKPDPYSDGEVEPHAMATISISKWVREMDTFSEHSHKGSYTDPFFSNIVTPIHQAGVSLQQGMLGMAQQQISTCYASDWKKAASSFIVRRSILESDK